MRHPGAIQPIGPGEDNLFAEEFVDDGDMALPGAAPGQTLVRSASGKFMIQSPDGKLQPATQQQIQEAQARQKQMHGAGIQSMAVGSSSAGMQSIPVGSMNAGLQAHTDNMNAGSQTLDPQTGRPIV